MRYFIHFAYNGSSYHGWQIQPDEITVQESLEKALSTILRDTMSVVGAGRTDSGVHARMMIAHFDMLTELADVNDLKHRLNAFLDEDIVIYDIKPVKSDAHARFTAVSRSYEYHIFLGRTPFYNDLCWEIYNRNLDIDAMNKAASILLEYNDFKAFSRTKTDVKTYLCDITHAEWKENENELIFYITANRFLRNMVRAIVGTLLEVGEGKLDLDGFRKVIESKNRSQAGSSVPAKGLFLTDIKYPGNIYVE